ncbi:threonine ammonia-lyase [Fulvivirga lutea]|uniref:Pyridoxal-phosphate dependent enzyme n=1 Tax=Fulvivirga lutea TaxID=2810512 RepID=A0A975A1C9_9BACT|nr:pyridoxal-phosphate dependent enzyme [Fulvivirga lutea]QSE98166.1 pyridoxal-phosphate dependent enzyme [Fulvivirga lutea]
MDFNTSTLKDFEEAHDRIRNHIHRTPILTNATINEMAGCSISFKCENFQKVGAFKARGGMNAILGLSDADKQKGVATHSSGNHAQAVALAAKVAGIKAWIVMPSNAPKVKKDAVKGYGAEVIECEPTIDAREDTLNAVIQENGALLIHPYNDERIIIGQGTATKELIEDAEKDFDYILTPIGGGGLISGAALVSHYLSPNTKVIGGEPEAADDAYRSFKSGQLVKNDGPPKTIADGLLTNLGDKNFEVIKKYVHDIYLVNDAEIMVALRLVWERMKIIIEPSCAVPLAVVLKNKSVFENKNVGIVLSGGNVDLGKIKFD